MMMMVMVVTEPGLITDYHRLTASIVARDILRPRLVFFGIGGVSSFGHLWEVASAAIWFEFLVFVLWGGGDVDAMNAGALHVAETRRRVRHFFTKPLIGALFIVCLIPTFEA